MGIEKELIDSHYPTFLVHIDTWNKMKTNFYDNQDGQQMMLATSEQQAEIGVYANIEVQDPAEPESMMSISLENRSDSMKVETITTKLEDIDLKGVDDYMDLCLMENTDSVVKDQIKDDDDV